MTATALNVPAAVATTAPVVKIGRKTLDRILVWLGAVIAVVLFIAAALLYWGSSFAGDYVSDELSAQNISFPDADSLTGQGRDDLVKFAGQQVTTGEQAEAYAGYIGGHIEGIADGMTYAELGGPERAANAAVTAAVADGADAATIAALEEEANAISEQRESIFRGEMLRGTLLNTFAWSTIGTIAGYAAWAAIAAGVVMTLLVFAGLGHLRKLSH
ncbi:MAG: hypothetical protein R2710_26565 [Acidimicrobiales bacterium]